MSNNIVLVVGSLNMDQVVRVPRIPVLGETLLGAGSINTIYTWDARCRKRLLDLMGGSWESGR